ncbi:MAG: ATP-dependent Clp protease adaptor ClpS [Burkholderiales bacterium]|nr:ATP-dependent Clp protease adaptor ClpS [Burkholderiales bacterium]
MSSPATAIVSTAFPRLPGFVRVARVGGASLDLHWSCFVGGVVLSAAGEYRPDLMLPLMIGYILVVLVHELWHALAARALGLTVYGIRLRGLGGHCITGLPLGARATIILFSAGLLAQAVLFAATLGARSQMGGPEGRTLGAFIVAFTLGNALAFVSSLVPWTSRDGLRSDGRVLLQVAIDLWHGRTIVGGSLPAMNSAAQSPVFPRGSSLLDMPHLVPKGFVQGVEILNDAGTPLAFVIDALYLHLGREGRQAHIDAVEIHNRGGLLLPFPTWAEAELAAAAVTAAAADARHPLVCRAVRRPDGAPSVTSA